MKIDARVKFVIDDEVLNIHVGDKVTIPVDEDYVSDFDDVIQTVEEKLYEDYGHSLHYSPDGDIHGDFVIENSQEICDQLFDRV